MDKSLLVAILLVAALVAQAILSRLKRGGNVRPLRPEQDAAIAKADKLWKSDPQAARQIMDGAFEKEGEREDEERAALRVRAKTDRVAADELRRRLREDLEVWEHLLKRSRKDAANDLTAQQAMVNQEKWKNETRAELAQVDELIRQLKR